MGDTELELLDFQDYPEILCDGVGAAQIFRKTFTVCLFRWRRIDGIFRRCTVAQVSRPMEEWELRPMKAFAAMYTEAPRVAH